MTVHIEMVQGSAVRDQTGYIRIFENNKCVYSISARIAEGHGADMQLYPYVRLLTVELEGRQDERKE